MSNTEDVSMADVDRSQVQEQEQEFDSEKIKLLPGASEDGTAASFQIVDDDHTLGNSLR